ncbi:MAG: hypothetical protein NT106_07030 [Candidatus Sumerlaeota bacterium]|nr:hypothetical protein [Candidatus Sumerlaeota bacterium]
MNAQWYFKEFPKGDTVRDPIQGEFFSSESIEKPAHTLIREGIQNSLDAALVEKKVVMPVYLIKYGLSFIHFLEGHR